MLSENIIKQAMYSEFDNSAQIKMRAHKTKSTYKNVFSQLLFENRT